MAEVYGVKPKPFTREWWPYYWMYYKWQTIGVAIAVMLIIVTAVQCATREKYDLTITYAGLGIFTDESIAKLETALEGVLEDSDGNGEVNVFVQQLTFDESAASAEMNYALQTKHDVEFTDDLTNLYLYDKYELEMILQREQASLTYMDVREWLDADIPEDKLEYAKDGVPCAVKLDDSELLGSVGMKTSDLYVAVKNNSKASELAQSSLRSAVAAANLMVK